jgi:hypothetical protein
VGSAGDTLEKVVIGASTRTSIRTAVKRLGHRQHQMSISAQMAAWSEAASTARVISS